MDAIASHIWQSTIFAAAAGMLALMFRNNSASVRYWIWFAAAAKFLVPLAALTAIANQIPMPQASDAATEALDAATLVFRTSALPEMSGAASIAILAVWLSGAVAVLATCDVAMAAPDCRCPSISADCRRRRVRHGQEHRAR